MICLFDQQNFLTAASALQETVHNQHRLALVLNLLNFFFFFNQRSLCHLLRKQGHDSECQACEVEVRMAPQGEKGRESRTVALACVFPSLSAPWPFCPRSPHPRRWRQGDEIRLDALFLQPFHLRYGHHASPAPPVVICHLEVKFSQLLESLPVRLEKSKRLPFL